MKINNLNDIEDNILCSMEQVVEFQVGTENYTYCILIERNNEGNITDIIMDTPLDNPKVDVETWIASRFIKEGDVWYDLDQKIFDTTTGEQFTYNWKPVEYGNPDIFNEDDEEYINKQMRDGTISIKITVTENLYEINEDE